MPRPFCLARRWNQLRVLSRVLALVLTAADCAVWRQLTRTHARTHARTLQPQVTISLFSTDFPMADKILSGKGEHDSFYVHNNA